MLSSRETGGRLSRALHTGTRGFFRFLLLPYWQAQVEGMEHVPALGPVLVACNHPTMVDPVLLVCLFPRKLDLLMNRGVRGIPLAGWVFHQAGHVTTGPQCLEECVRKLRRGQAVGVFPEGRHSYSDTLGGFHAGISVLAQRSGAPVLPVAILGNQRFLSARSAFMDGGPLRVAIGPPLSCPPEETVEAFGARLHQTISGQMQSISSPRPWSPDWRFRLAQAFWRPFSRALFALADRLKPDNVR